MQALAVICKCRETNQQMTEIKLTNGTETFLCGRVTEDQYGAIHALDCRGMGYTRCDTGCCSDDIPSGAIGWHDDEHTETLWELDAAGKLTAALITNEDQHTMRTRYYLYTQAGADKLNGTAWIDRDEMLAAVRKVYGDGCDFGISAGEILDEDQNEVANFGEYETSWECPV
jgi:hypothetical protein